MSEIIEKALYDSRIFTLIFSYIILALMSLTIAVKIDDADAKNWAITNSRIFQGFYKILAKFKDFQGLENEANFFKDFQVFLRMWES